MATFIMAMQINPGAKKHREDLSSKINASFELFRANKIKVNNLFATLGRYDYIAVFDANDQTVAFKLASEINNQGILETETWPVINYDEFTQLISSGWEV